MNMETLNVRLSDAEEISLTGIDYIASGNQYLSFSLGDEHYSVDILRVTEIRGWELPTLIPNSPRDVLGVVNLRGVIVPVVDLRIRFGVGKVDYLATTVVIILSIEHNSGHRMMGFVVDAVSDVLNVEDKDIKKAPNFNGTISQQSIIGLVNVGTNVVTVLDAHQLMSLDESGHTEGRL